MPDQTGIAAAVSRMFHQHYFVEMPGIANAAALSLQSFEAREPLGSPYCIPVTLSHPEKLLRGDILGKA